MHIYSTEYGTTIMKISDRLEEYRYVLSYSMHKTKATRRPPPTHSSWS